MPKIANIKRNKPSKRPIIGEKRDTKLNFSGLNLEQARELSTILDSRNQRISVQKKKSSIINKRSDRRISE